MRKLTCMLMGVIILLAPMLVLARGGTHYVRSYTKKNGTHIQGHQSGNPRSGVHCHGNFCY